MLVEKTNANGKTSVLIDTGPDMREQLLSAEVTYLDAVMLTHEHADHIFGLDDLRQLAIAHREKVNVYIDELTSHYIMQAFGYCFTQAEGSSYPAICAEHRIIAGNSVTVDGAGGAITGLPFEVNHGDIKALGYRFGDLIYMPDVKTVTDPASLAAFSKVDTLIIDALRYTPHPTHMNVEEALDFIEKVKPNRAILTNMHVDIDYSSISAELPANVEAAFDGMTISYP